MNQGNRPPRLGEDPVRGRFADLGVLDADDQGRRIRRARRIGHGIIGEDRRAIEAIGSLVVEPIDLGQLEGLHRNYPGLVAGFERLDRRVADLEYFDRLLVLFDPNHGGRRGEGLGLLVERVLEGRRCFLAEWGEFLDRIRCCTRDPGRFRGRKGFVHRPAERLTTADRHPESTGSGHDLPPLETTGFEASIDDHSDLALMAAHPNPRHEAGIDADIARTRGRLESHQIYDQARGILEREGFDGTDATIGFERHQHAEIHGLHRHAGQLGRSRQRLGNRHRSRRHQRRIVHVHPVGGILDGLPGLHVGHLGRDLLIGPVRRQFGGHVEVATQSCGGNPDLKPLARRDDLGLARVCHRDLHPSERRTAFLFEGRERHQVDHTIIGRNLLGFVRGHAHRALRLGLIHPDQVHDDQVRIVQSRHRIGRILQSRETNDTAIPVPRDRHFCDRLNRRADRKARRHLRRSTTHHSNGHNKRCHHVLDSNFEPSVSRIDHRAHPPWLRRIRNSTSFVVRSPAKFSYVSLTRTRLSPM